MAFLNKKRKKEVEIPNASLSDIAFLILIFFLVSTTIDMDKGIPQILPAKGEQTEVRKENITNILIDARGKVLMDNQDVEIRNIKSEAQRMLAENEKMIFSVKTHAKTKYQTYIGVLDQLKQANARRISIAE